MASAILAPCELTEERIEQVRAELVETDGEPLETPWHRAAIALLIEVVVWLLRGRTDYFVGGNMFIYYSLTQARGREYRGPDFFFVKDVDGTRERSYWWVFEEDSRYPDVILELSSPSTAAEDRTTKKDIYERVFRTPEYFIYDPETRLIAGWRLVQGRYEPIVPNERGWLWSEHVQLWVGTWEGSYLGRTALWPRFYAKEGQLVPTETEDQRSRALSAQQQAESERRRAETAQQEAESERRRAEAAQQRMQDLEAELTRLQSLLAAKGPPTPPPEGTS